jgi:hypothetical protein
MSKVDLERMKILEQRYRDSWRELLAVGLFCYLCGETKPSRGFFPLHCSLWGFSGVKCNDCAAANDEEWSHYLDSVGAVRMNENCPT